MPSPASGPLRAVRAVAVAVTTVALGALAHVLGGGAAPSTVLLGALVALLFAPAVLVTRRRLGPLGAVAALGVGQGFVHVALGLVGPAACVVPGAAAGPHAGHGVAGAAAELAAASAGGGAGSGSLVTTVALAAGGASVAGAHAGCAPVAAHLVLGASTMLVVHVLATVATGLLLAGGERALWWCAVWLRPLVDPPAPAAVPVLPRLVVARAPRAVARPLRREVWSLRGPPAAAPAHA